MTTVGLLGCAHVHAATYVAELRRLAPRVRVLGLHDEQPERSRRFADAHGLEVFATAESLCESVDAVVITAEHARYAGLARVAAERGCRILCEKPLGVDAVSSDELRALDAWASVAFPVRYAPAVRQARRAFRSGSLGGLLAMSGVNHAPAPGGFFADPQLSGGGAIVDHVVHLADALRFITGCEYADVFAEAGRLHADSRVEEVAQVVVTTTDGAWASIDPGWSRPQGMAGGVDFEMQLWFEGGRVLVDAFARHAVLTSPGGRVAHLPYDPGIDAAMLADWVGAIEDGAPPPVPLEEGWRATRVALGALESAATGDVVDLQSKEIPA
ncbi:putative dehydrogenase [Motilibacter rhizosphaerae]|uniref:Putative dehydrogenase n=1 Tax=Motilibacter rhizosphaerae TaxID=598652 RepID=A0A4Q7NWM5_9ACTN|nr:Gfo/Idh/MocA family oxidoreductase [Motilibacter rhizosphaerae]RZS91726.1 putative dehydrogenase [Motilibacter rhizosphaerae]